jgi:TM2 domain-containing membrane protein YozV
MESAAVWPNRRNAPTVAFAPTKNPWPPVKPAAGHGPWSDRPSAPSEFVPGGRDRFDREAAGAGAGYAASDNGWGALGAHKRAETRSPSHAVWLGYVLWVIGFTGAHRFYYGRPRTGALWFCTGGFFLVGWLIDVLLIPRMARSADRRFRQGPYDYQVGWILHLLLGPFGAARFYQGRFITGLLWFLTGGLCLVGWIYDMFTLNRQIDESNRQPFAWWE